MESIHCQKLETAYMYNFKCFYSFDSNGLLRTNFAILLKFYRERERLRRQILRGNNVLTCFLRYEIVEIIVEYIYNDMRPVFIETDFIDLNETLPNVIV